jgi:hypothetical protein
MMDRYEIRLELDEVIARELLWQALVPEAMVLTPALSKAIAAQQERLGVPAEGYHVAGISVAHDPTGMYAEVEFACDEERGAGEER